MLLPHTVTPVPPGSDDEPAVTVGGRTLSRTELIGASTAVAERLGGLGVRGPVAVWAEPTLATVVALVGALRAGVPAVPVPPDSGSDEIAHVLRDSGAQAWLGATPQDPHGLPAVPVREHARGWHVLAEPPRRRGRTDHVHLRHHRCAEGRPDPAGRDRRVHRWPRGRLGLDRR